MEMTLEQKRALAVAKAKAAAEGEGLSVEEQAAAFRSPEAREARDAATLEQYARDHPIASKAATFLSGIPAVGSYIDEGLGKVSEFFGGNDAETSTEAIRAMRALEERERPYQSMALKLGGGLTAAAPAIAALPSLGGGMSLGARALIGGGAGAAGGATEGAIYGYGEGTTPETRRQEARKGAVIGGFVGGGLGAASPAVSDLASAGTKRVLDALTSRKRRAAVGVSKPTSEILTRAMDADGSFAGRGAQNINRAGPDAMLADSGPNARALLDTSIQRSGPAGNIARNAIDLRAAYANQTVNRALDKTLGTPRGVGTSERAIREGTAAARKTAYDAAYSRPIDYADPVGQEVESLVRNNVPHEAITAANKLMRAEGNQSKQILAKVADDGSVTFERLPDVRQLDYITRGLNEVADAAHGQGKLGGTSQVGAAYENLSRKIRGRLKQLVPEYEIALDTASDAISERNALRFGQDLLKPSTLREEVGDFMDGISRADRSAAMQGLRSHIDDTLANVQRAVTDGNMDAREAIKAVKELSSRASREKVTALVGQDAANELFNEISKATMALDLRAGVQQNSKTFARESMDRTIRDQADGGVVGALKEGRVPGATQRIVQALTGRTPEAKLAEQDAVYEQIARILTERRGADASRALGDLSYISRQDPRNAAIARRLASPAARALGLSAYQQGTQRFRGPQ